MRIWADIDNAPHVLVLQPVIRLMKELGHHVEVTARDFGQTFGLLELHGIPFTPVGRHAGRNLFKKVFETLGRSRRLMSYSKGRDFSVAFCHGARGVVLPARLRGIPLVVLLDYEHTFNRIFRWWAARILVPDVISDECLDALGFDLSRVVKYPGLKEDLYVHEGEPDPSVLQELGVHPESILAVMRPPATMAHYHSDRSDLLFWAAVDRLDGDPRVQIVMLPRTEAQAAEILAAHRQLRRVIFPKKTVHAPDLLRFADLVFSGGGTMTREAACIGVPSYSVFGGEQGAVDAYLESRGLLRMIRDPRDVDSIPVVKRVAGTRPSARTDPMTLARFVADRILEVAR
jgi:predicted glycosyltransferase